jgi:methyl-accepting chemotaxis protein
MNLLKQWKIGTRLAAGFVIVIVAGLAVAAYGWSQLRGLDRMVQSLAEDRMVKVAQFSQMKDNANVVARGVRNMVLLDDHAEMAKERKRIDEMRTANDALVAALQRTAVSDDERGGLQAMQAANAGYGASLDKAMASALADKDDEARSTLLKETRPLQQAYFKSLDALKELEEKSMRDTAAAVSRSATSAGTMMAVVAAIAAACGLMLAWLLTRSITEPIREAVQVARTVAAGDLTREIRPVGRDETAELLTAMGAMTHSLAGLVTTVRDASESIATGSGQIATGNADLSQRTEEQASNLQQTAASMEQLAGTVKANADTARQASDLAGAASAIASEGGGVVGRAVSTMDDISTSSRKIADIIGVIDGIAFQTNILALNAAVEAARAGEQGRGFAVVAGEVRTLAQRSAEAAKEIKSLINDSVERVAAGASLVGEAGKTMDSVVEQVRRVAEMINAISSASAEQDAGIGQVGHAVSQLDTVTQQNAALVEESAAAADSLNQQARRLVQAVSVFRLQAA